MGSELVGVTVGEAQNPRKNVPRGIAHRARSTNMTAIKLVFWRILIVNPPPDRADLIVLQYSLSDELY